MKLRSQLSVHCPNYKIMDSFLFSFMATILLLPGAAAEVGTGHMGSIGVIVDNSSRIGKEEIVAMKLAIHDFNNKPNRQLDLHVRDSQSDPVLTLLSARNLIKKRRVQAIIGLETWEEASLVVELGSKAHIPIVSLADAAPQWATDRWPFLVLASPEKHLQMKAVAAIIGSWGWRRINVIYEDTNSAGSEIIPFLADALKQVGSEIGYLAALPPSSAVNSSSLSDQLQWLKGKQSQVFVVHSSLSMAERLFSKANELGMIEKGSVWITTDSITNLVHSMNSSVISSMEGVLGVKSFFQEDGARFQDFYSRFRQKFRSLYPKEDNHEPGIFAVQAYDAVWSVALAMDNNGSTQQLLEKIELSDFHGLTNRIKFERRRLAPQRMFQIVNVIGKSYRELGFWSEGSGFAKPTNGPIQYSSSMDILGQVFWPGAPTSTPRGWAFPTSETPLRIGVPLNATFKQFVSVNYDIDGGHQSVSGFSIEVFKAVLKHLKYNLSYEFFPYSGTYDDLVEQVHLKKFDAVVGDTSVVSKRWDLAEFSHPYTEPGLVMIVPEQVDKSNRAWLFMKPFTKAMWVLTGAITIYNGFTLWLIERNQNPELMTGSTLNQMGTLVCLSFTTLFSMHGGRQHSNLSRLVMVVWLFASLVITNSYTANLTSMLTVQRLEPTVVDVEDLKRDNAIVGCSRRSFVVRYLVDVIGIKMRNIKDITSADQYARDLRSGEIAAAFIEAPYAKIFLAQNCKGFAASGKTYQVGGFGFVFPKGSPILPDISKAVLEVSESGELRELQNMLIGCQKCNSNITETSEDSSSLSPSSFWVLFLITGGVSTVCLVIFMARERLTYLYNHSLGHMAIWRLISAVMRSWRSHPRERFSRGISDEESNGNAQHTSMHSPQYFGYRVPWQRNYSSRSFPKFTS